MGLFSGLAKAAGGLVGGLFGGGTKQVQTGGSQTIADPRAEFKPITYTSGMGTGSITGGADGLTPSYALNQNLQDLQQMGYAAAPNMFSRYLEEAGAYQPRTLGVSWDPNQLRDQSFADYQRASQPYLNQLYGKNAMNRFGTGTGGLSLSADALASGGDGLLNAGNYENAIAAQDMMYRNWNQAGIDAQNQLANQMNFLGAQDNSQLGLINLLNQGATQGYNVGQQIDRDQMQLLKDLMNMETQRGNTFVNQTASTYGSAPTTGANIANSIGQGLIDNAGPIGDWVSGLFSPSTNSYGGDSSWSTPSGGWYDDKTPYYDSAQDWNYWG